MSGCSGNVTSRLRKVAIEFHISRIDVCRDGYRSCSRVCRCREIIVAAVDCRANRDFVVGGKGQTLGFIRVVDRCADGYVSIFRTTGVRRLDFNICRVKSQFNIVDFQLRTVSCWFKRIRNRCSRRRIIDNLNVRRVDEPGARIAVGSSGIDAPLDAHRLVARGFDEAAVAGLRAALRLNAGTLHQVGVVLRDHLDGAAVAVGAGVRGDDGILAKGYRVRGVDADSSGVADSSVCGDRAEVADVVAGNSHVAAGDARRADRPVHKHLIGRGEGHVAVRCLYAAVHRDAPCGRGAHALALK